MINEVTEVLSDHHQSVVGHVILSDIHLSGLPETISISNIKLVRKNEFHITIINSNRIAELIDSGNVASIKADLIDECKKFISENKLKKFKLLNQFRFVQEGDKKTAIVMCDFPDGEELFTHLNKKYAKSLPLQPFHITLYSLHPEVGIGILSEHELEQISVAVDIPELMSMKTD